MTNIDTHIHYIDEDAIDYIDTLLRRMDENDVEKCVLFGVQGDPICGDCGVWHAVNAHPDRFIPFACSLRCELDRDAEVFANYAFKHPWRGVGEVYIDLGGEFGVTYSTRSGRTAFFPHYCPEYRHLNSVYGEIFAECGKRGWPVSAHCRSIESMEGLLKQHPYTNFIWAHVDHMLVEDDTIPMLDRYPNLYCEVGIQFGFVSQEILSQEFGEENAWIPRRFKAWQEAANRHPSRILWGSDVFSWPDLVDPEPYRRNRKVFKLFCDPLSHEAKAGVAEGNILSLIDGQDGR